MRTLTCTFALILTACSASSSENQLSECLAIQSTTYVEGQVRDCLVERHGWDVAKAEEAARNHRDELFPDGSRKPEGELATEGSEDASARQ